MTATDAPDARASRLDAAGQDRFADRLLWTETTDLLRHVRNHDLERLSALCDDDFGIVDVDPAGNGVHVPDREAWTNWFTTLFATLDALGAETDSEVTGYDVLAGTDMAYVNLEFRQFLEIGELVATFDAVATIVWKHTADGWREARWHCSVLRQDVPDEMAAMTGG